MGSGIQSVGQCGICIYHIGIRLHRSELWRLWFSERRELWQGNIVICGDGKTEGGSLISLLERSLCDHGAGGTYVELDTSTYYTLKWALLFPFSIIESRQCPAKSLGPQPTLIIHTSHHIYRRLTPAFPTNLHSVNVVFPPVKLASLIPRGFRGPSGPTES